MSRKNQENASTFWCAFVTAAVFVAAILLSQQNACGAVSQPTYSEVLDHFDEIASVRGRYLPLGESPGERMEKAKEFRERLGIETANLRKILEKIKPFLKGAVTGG